MVGWKDIHEDFNEYYQRKWEEQDLTPQDAEQWILVGLEPTDYNFVLYSKQNNITPEQYKDNSSIILNHIYPNKSQVEEIDLDCLNSNQPSELIIDNYSKLKKISGQKISNLTQLTITNCPQLEEININSLENFQQLNFQQLILNNLPNLKELYCQGNKLLANLDLSDYANLESIYCQDNQLTQIKLPSGEKLEYLNLNQNNLQQDLSFLKGLVNLKELDLSNNPLYGSLEHLKGMSKLETLNIGDTDLDSGLECLPTSVREFECLVFKRKDAKVKAIQEKLEICGGTIQGWRQALKKEQQNQEELRKAEERRIITLLIPVDKLYTIRRGMDKFLGRWNNGLKDLQWVERYKFKEIINTIQWANRGVLVASGVQLIRGDSSMSDWTTLISPFVEVFISNLEEKYETNKLKQTIFADDSENIWDNYSELKDILDPDWITLLSEGNIKKDLKDLIDKIDDFWKKYDTNQDKKIDDEELKLAKEDFPKKWQNNWAEKKAELEAIKEAIEKLRAEVSNYRKSEAQDSADKQKEETNQTQSQSSDQQQVAINIDQEQKAQIQQAETYGTPGSSKPPK
jgi:hypothetical protein